MDPRTIVRALHLVAGAALVSGCAGGAWGDAAGVRPAAGHARSARLAGARSPLSLTKPGVELATRPAWMRSAPAGAPRPTVYVSQFSRTAINDYPSRDKKNRPPLCEISVPTAVNGIGLDPAGNLWAPVGGEFSGTVEIFAPNCGAELSSFAVSNGQPAGVAFDSAKNAYVLNIMDENANGNIDVYAPGTTQPEKTLNDPQSFRFFDEAIDAHDDVFVGWADAVNDGHLDEFAGANNPPVTLPLQYGFPGGVVLDAKGNLLVVDDDALRVNVLAPPYTGQPFTSFQIQGASVPCRFGPKGRLLYCSNYAAASVDVYGYDAAAPGSTKYLYSFNNGMTHGASNAGIAIAP
jgi:sugar lactone lactonase YvrE